MPVKEPSISEIGLLEFEKRLAGKRVLVTGHTGFTGSWACQWLHAIGAEVSGLALEPETDPSLFAVLGLDQYVRSEIGDVCDYARVHDVFATTQPEVVLHLAAQPLVRRSYREPVPTFATNVMGTAHVLEAARLTPSVRAVVCITTDKVYQNREWPWPYRENDRLGGKDPYSASKAAAEMVIQSYAHAFADTTDGKLSIATARGGNIIGGGDWSEDRLVPDFARALTRRSTLTLRYPDAIRPWQHVLALVQGYLMLLSGLLAAPKRYARAWNLGPHDPRPYTVREVLELLCDAWDRPALEYMENPLPEAGTLMLDSSLARNVMGWKTPWDTAQVVRETGAWYRDYYSNPMSAGDLTSDQLQRWRQALAKLHG